MLRSFTIKRKLILIISTVTIILVSAFYGCQKTEYDNPHDSSVNTSLWAPQSFTTAQTSLKTAELKWVQPDQRIDSFCIESRRNNGVWKVLGYNDKSQTSFIDSTYIPDAKTPIDYRITAIAWKNKSFSQIKSITPVFGKPYIPAATKDVGVRIKVVWYDTYSNEDGYKLEKKVNGGSWMLCADTIRGNSTFYYDKNPELNALITYRISVRAAGVYSDTTGAMPLSTIIAPPTWFTIASLSQTSCRVDWKQGEDWTTGYKVDRQFGNNPWQDGWLNLDNTKLTFTDTNLPTDQDIKYRVSTIVNNSYSMPKDLVYGLALLDTIALSNSTYTSVNLKSKVLDEVGSAVTEWGIVYGLNPNPTIADSKVIANTAGNVGFTTTLTGLDNSKTYYSRSYAINRRGESYGKQKIFQSNPWVLPQLDVTSISNIYQTEVYTNSKILNDGGVAILESGFVYSKTPAPTINDLKALNGLTNPPNNGVYLLGKYLFNLDFGTTYYVRSYAINSVGVSYGKENTFKTTTFNLPTIDTLTIAYVDVDKAQVESDYFTDGGDNTTVFGFVYGNSANPTISDNVLTKIKVTVNVHSLHYVGYIINLNPNQTYHIRAFGQNRAGVVYSNDKIITTKNYSLPILGVTTMSSVGYVNATANSKIIGNGGSAILETGFLYSMSPVPTISDFKLQGAINFPDYTLFSFMNSLVDGATYYIRSYARNSIGLAYGPVTQFTTQLILQPKVDTVFISYLYTSSVYLTSSVTTNGGDVTSQDGFVYGDNPGPTLADNKLLINTGRQSGDFSVLLQNLLPDHKYYIRSYVKNVKGIVYSNDKSFTTKSLSVPIIDVIDSYNIEVTSLSLWCNIANTGGLPLIESGCVYSTHPGTTVNDNKIVATNVPMQYNGQYYLFTKIDGLTHGVTYYTRLFSTNSMGTGYSPERTIKLP